MTDNSLLKYYVFSLNYILVFVGSPKTGHKKSNDDPATKRTGPSLV